MTLVGTMMGHVALANSGTLGFRSPQGTASEASMWTSDTMVRAKTAASVGLGMSVALTIWGQVQMGTLSMALSNDGVVAAVISGVARQWNSPTSGAASVTLIGVSVGSGGGAAGSVSAASRIGGGGTGFESSLWTSESSLAVKGSGGGFTRFISQQQGVVLSIALRQVGTTTRCLSFDAPRPGDAMMTRLNIPSSGATSVSILAAGGFGGATPSHSMTARVRGTGLPVSSWRSDTCIVGLSSWGVGGWHAVVVSAGFTSYSFLQHLVC